MANLKISDDPEIAVKQMARELANNSIVNKALARYIEQILEAVNEDTIQPLRDRISQQDAELERMRRELEEAREALRPFAEHAAEYDDDDPDYQQDWPTFTIGDFRRARAAGRGKAEETRT